MTDRVKNLAALRYAQVERNRDLFVWFSKCPERSRTVFTFQENHHAGIGYPDGVKLTEATDLSNPSGMREAAKELLALADWFEQKPK
jgi:hypothetical protein